MLLAAGALLLAGAAGSAADPQPIYFVSHQSGTPQIYVMNEDGSNQHALTSGTRPNFDPAVSPDGAKIAFTSYRDGDPEIYLMNADGSAQTNLTHNPATLDSQPAFSPAGSQLVFTRGPNPQNSDLVRMDLSGANQLSLTATADFFEGYADWSPDGSRIVFARSPVSDVTGTDLYTIAPDGSGLSRLTQGAGVEIDPAWSPDGTQVIYAKADLPPTAAVLGGDLYLIDRDGSGEHAILSDNAVDAQPTWLSDTDVLFASNRSLSKRGVAIGDFKILRGKLDRGGFFSAPLGELGTENPFTDEQPAVKPPAIPPVDMSITKTADVNALTRGEKVTYTIVVKNNDELRLAKSFAIVDRFPHSLAFVSVKYTTSDSLAVIRCNELKPGQISGGTIDCTVDNLGRQQTVTLTVVAEGFITGSYENQAAISSPINPDENPSNDEATTTIQVRPEQALPPRRFTDKVSSTKPKAHSVRVGPNSGVKIESKWTGKGTSVELRKVTYEPAKVRRAAAGMKKPRPVKVRTQRGKGSIRASIGRLSPGGVLRFQVVAVKLAHPTVIKTTVTQLAPK